jgi:hypothetical protein
MKNSLLILMVICITSCFLDLDRFQFLDEPQAIVGKWKMVSYTPDKTRKTVIVNSSNSHTFEVRYDGVSLETNGKRMCCVNLSYMQNINGKIYYIKNAEPIPDNSDCNLVDCGSSCSPRWIVTADSLFSEGCYNTKYKYVRVK